MSSDDESSRVKLERLATPTVSEPDEKGPADEIPGLEGGRRRSRRRVANVYDAVAGRISHQRGTLTEDQESKTPLPGTTKHSVQGTPHGPDEVLFRRKDAPHRYAEHDIYYSHERELPHGGRGTLPESDLLKAVHGYSSRFYESLHRGNKHRIIRRRRGNVDAHSMDETALLAFGILLEEAGKDVLGKRGDMVFTEGMEEDGEEEGGRGEGSKSRVKSSVPDAVGPLEEMSSKKIHRPKRRRVMKPEPEPEPE